MDWFYLALLSPLFFAVVNLIDDNLLHHVYKLPHMGSVFSGILGALPLLSLFFVDVQPVAIPIAIVAVAAGFLTTVYYYFYFRALEKESPSIVVAMYSLAPVLILVLAHYFLGEQLNSRQLAGFAVVVIGSFGLALAEIRKFKFSPSFPLMVLAVSIFALTTLLMKYVYEATNFYTGYMCFAAGMGLGGLYFLLVVYFWNEKSVVKDLSRNSPKIIGALIVAEIIAIVAEFTHNLAISRGPVSLVQAVGGVQPVYVLLIALALYRFSPMHFREATHGSLVKKLSLMCFIIFGLYLVGQVPN